MKSTKTTKRNTTKSTEPKAVQMPKAPKAKKAKDAEVVALQPTNVQPVAVSTHEEIFGKKKITPISKELMVEVVTQNMRSPSLWSVLNFLIQEFGLAVKVEKGTRGKFNGTWYRVFKNATDVEPWYSFHDSETAMKPFVTKVVKELIQNETSTETITEAV